MGVSQKVESNRCHLYDQGSLTLKHVVPWGFQETRARHGRRFFQMSQNIAEMFINHEVFVSGYCTKPSNDTVPRCSFHGLSK